MLRSKQDKLCKHLVLYSQMAPPSFLYTALFRGGLIAITHTAQAPFPTGFWLGLAEGRAARTLASRSLEEAGGASSDVQDSGYIFVVLDPVIHTAIYKIDNQQGPTV